MPISPISESNQDDSKLPLSSQPKGIHRDHSYNSESEKEVEAEKWSFEDFMSEEADSDSSANSHTSLAGRVSYEENTNKSNIPAKDISKTPNDGKIQNPQSAALGIVTTRGEEVMLDNKKDGEEKTQTNPGLSIAQAGQDVLEQHIKGEPEKEDTDKAKNITEGELGKTEKLEGASKTDVSEKTQQSELRKGDIERLGQVAFNTGSSSVWKGQLKLSPLLEGIVAVSREIVKDIPPQKLNKSIEELGKIAGSTGSFRIYKPAKEEKEAKNKPIGSEEAAKDGVEKFSDG